MVKVVAVVDSTVARGIVIAEAFRKHDTVAYMCTGDEWVGETIPCGQCPILVLIHHGDRAILEDKEFGCLTESDRVKIIFYSGGMLPPLPDAFSIRETIKDADAARSLLTDNVVGDILAWVQGEKAVAPAIIANPDCVDKKGQRPFLILCEIYLLLHACDEQNGIRCCNKDSLPEELWSKVEALDKPTDTLPDSAWNDLEKRRNDTETKEFWMVGYQEDEILSFAGHIGIDEIDIRTIIGLNTSKNKQDKSEAVKKVWTILDRMKKE